MRTLAKPETWVMAVKRLKLSQMIAPMINGLGTDTFAGFPGAHKRPQNEGLFTICVSIGISLSSGSAKNVSARVN
ncbi:hypothetical protein GCM10027046_04100 [Uliginosibacterium flavum]